MLWSLVKLVICFVIVDLVDLVISFENITASYTCFHRILLERLMEALSYMSIVYLSDVVCCSLLFSYQQLTLKVERNVWTGMKLPHLSRGNSRK